MTEPPKLRHSMPYLFKNGVIHGLGWSFGATIGFLIISTLLVIVLRYLGGLPLIGQLISPVVETTEKQLEYRTPLKPSSPSF